MKRRRRFLPNTQPDTTTGSSTSGEPVYLAVGRLRRPHGIEGAIYMEVLTDFPDRLRTGRTVYVGDAHEPMRLVSLRRTDRDMIVRLAGFHTPEEIGRLRNETVFIKATNLPKLPEGEYYHHQLLGLKVIDETGSLVGLLDQILETGANDVYLIKSPDGKEILLPAVEEVVLGVDLEKGEISVRLPEYY
jgi:16S rRNA processing protein RimM